MMKSTGNEPTADKTRDGAQAQSRDASIHESDQLDINEEGEFVEEVGSEFATQSHRQLMWRQFKKHKLAMVSMWLLILFYATTVVAPGFFAPYGKLTRFDDIYVPPQRIRLFTADGEFYGRPFVYPMERVVDTATWDIHYKPNTELIQPIKFFMRGDSYRILGLFPADLHLIGMADGGRVTLFGTDSLGRDLFSRTLYGCQISLTIGFVGVFISLFLGLALGGLSGLIGGVVDDVIQRIIELLLSIPTIPLWMALAAAIPSDWNTVQVYFAITVLLSLIGWTGLARVIRSKFISLREEDFVIAARLCGVRTGNIIARHLVPNFFSYIIVNLTLAIPQMILAETALSFLGLGLQAPAVSLGVLLKAAQNFQAISLQPWLMIPGLFVILFVLAYNFVGDGLRDAADPFQVS